MELQGAYFLEGKLQVALTAAHHRIHTSELLGKTQKEKRCCGIYVA
jgi:hypothetical protein